VAPKARNAPASSARDCDHSCERSQSGEECRGTIKKLATSESSRKLFRTSSARYEYLNLCRAGFRTRFASVFYGARRTCARCEQPKSKDPPTIKPHRQECLCYWRRQTLVDCLGHTATTHYCGALRASDAGRDDTRHGLGLGRRDLELALSLDHSRSYGIVQVGVHTRSRSLPRMPRRSRRAAQFVGCGRKASDQAPKKQILKLHTAKSN